ncbi:MAG: T9SS type A sorting domain-containing protein [candidate division WOR-3 bacterium]|nr:MAG: T9SS type A sorting domain-containing protein [candidate division WOR-3 bacterium]
MKRLSLLALAVAVGVGLAASISETFEFESGMLEIGSQDGYATVTLPVAPHCEPLGAPDLPVVTYHAVIPPTAEVTGFEIVELEEEVIPGSYSILPVQHPVPWSVDYEKQPFVRPDPAYYEVDAVYPASAARLGTVGNKGGYRLVNFGIHPVRYNPVEERLYLVKRIQVRLDYASGKRHAVRRTELQNMIHGSWVSRLVLNPADVGRFSPPVRQTGRSSSFLPEGEYEHVIITTSPWTDSLQPLKEWRTRQGWRSTIMLLSDITSDYPGRDTPEKVRNFIKDADTTWGTIYVFIARDDYPSNSDVRVTVPYSSYNTKCDMYYTDLDGDWDADGDNVFGEVTDSVDGYADVYVGMITITDGSELSNYMRKIFAYEFNPDTSDTWATKQLLPNGVSFSDEFNDSCAVASQTPPWYDLKMYNSGQGQVRPTPQLFCDSLNSGYSLGSIIAHGAPDLFQLGGDVTSAMMLALNNPGRLNYSTYVCCNTGEWDRGSTNGDCIAENMVFHAENGFIGVLKNDKSGWIRCAELFNYAHMFGAFGYKTERCPTMSEINSYGKDFWVWTFQDSGKYRMEAQERNLFGAPAVPVWVQRPFVASVTRPGAINIGNNIPVQITVTDGSDAAVESTMVCLIKGTETFARGWTDASGQLTLYVSPLTPGMMNLTVSSGLHLPYLDSIAVIAAGKYVSYLRHFVVDSVGGNGDGIINPGETVDIPTWVKNYGDSTARYVEADLRTHTPGCSIVDDFGEFGDIPGRDSAFDEDGFTLQLANGLPNGYAIPCSLVVYEEFGEWVSFVTFRVGAPVLSCVSFEVRDEGSGQPNGRLDPGETADLEVTLSNSGLGHAENVFAVLRAFDTLLTVEDDSGTFGTVMAGSTKVNTADRFTLTADAAMQLETPVLCTLDIYADNGVEEHAEFVLVVAELRAIDPIPDGPRRPSLYYAYDECDTMYDPHPSFDWVEINGVGTRIAYSQNDAVVMVNLPPAFGPFYFYGRRYTQVSVSADGWICPGNYTTGNYSNTRLPDPSTPPGMVCLNWDDLYPSYLSQGHVYHYHDADNHRFVIEYDSVAYWNPRTIRDKFQVLIYDTTVTTFTGDNAVVAQYMTVNGYSSTTVGIEDPGRTIAIQALFDGEYHRGCAQIAPGRAIKYTTDPPDPTGLEEKTGAFSVLRGRRLAVAPSPFSRSASVHWSLERDADVSLTVFDASGRAVRTLVKGQARAGAHTSVWNGTDDYGRRLARGIYFVRLKTPETTLKVKTVLTR